jgi:ABC-2 type transport system permease protein
MVFAWVDRWLSTRRAREIFTGLIFAFSIGIQYLNFAFNPAYNHGHAYHHDISRRVTFMANLYHRAHPLLAWLPPELTRPRWFFAPPHLDSAAHALRPVLQGGALRAA